MVNFQALTAILSAVGLSFLSFFTSNAEEIYSYNPSGEAFYNPLMGFAPGADYIDAVGENTLVYVDVTWRELEPSEGYYDFASIEASNYLSNWKGLGKHVVFRFVCDIPGSESHMDIPDWLFEKTKDGTFYDMAYGKGYSPDYGNETFIQAHEKAVKALGARYGGDGFFAYVELGSIGHWGEWHVKYDSGIKRLPEEKTIMRYVTPYLEAFPNAKILMRRPFQAVKDYGFGVYNDMAGREEDTRIWLDWIQNGGSYEEPESPYRLPAVPNIWNRSPIGGEFTSAIPEDELFSGSLDKTLSLLKSSHMTFIGPKTMGYHQEAVQYPAAAMEISKNIGYRYGISSARVWNNYRQGRIKAGIEVENSGTAPIYFNWPMYAYLFDSNRNIIARQPVNIDLRKLTQGQKRYVSFEFRNSALQTERCSVGIGIENPETNLPAVKLNMECESIGNIYMLFY